eukprot:2227696-Alexandrium_andersonii.AAC.1
MLIPIPALLEWVRDQRVGGDADQVGLLQDLQVPVDAVGPGELVRRPDLELLRLLVLLVAIAPVEVLREEPALRPLPDALQILQNLFAGWDLPVELPDP